MVQRPKQRQPRARGFRLNNSPPTVIESGILADERPVEKQPGPPRVEKIAPVGWGRRWSLSERKAGGQIGRPPLSFLKLAITPDAS
jgi:hypothetical protein